MEEITARDVQQMFADVAGTGLYGCFEYQGVSLGLGTDDAALLDWFSGFFSGYFTVTTSDRTDAVVYSTQDRAVFERLKEQATAHGRPRSDDEIEYDVDDQNRVVYSRKAERKTGDVVESCFVLSRPGRRVLVACPGAPEERRDTVKRSLRNTMKLLFMEKGWVPFHSAACVWNDTGICILGGKFAGKTSTLVNLLARTGAKLVTNDNLFLRDAGSRLEGCGFPNKAGLRIGALAAYPRLMEWVATTTDSFYRQIDARTVREILATTPADELGRRPERIVLLSTELAEQFGVPIEHVADIRVFLVVHFDPALEQSRLVPLTDRQQIRDALEPSFRSLRKEKQDFLQGFFDLDDGAVQGTFDAMLDKFASRVTVLELHQGARTNEHSAELVQELTRGLHQPA
jgi:hypothetical protein